MSSTKTKSPSKSKTESPKKNEKPEKKGSAQKQDQLINILDFNPDNLLFSDLVEGKVKDDPKINFWRVSLATQNVEMDGEKPTDQLDGTVGDPYLRFPEMFCFGVQESKSQDDDKKDDGKKKSAGHSCSFVLEDKEGASPQQRAVTAKIREIIAKIKSHILTLEDMIGRDADELKVGVKDLDKLIYQKRDKKTGKVAADAGPPSINPKLIEFTGKNGALTIETTFYTEDENGELETVSPLDYLSTDTQKKYFRGTPTIKLDSVFINSKTISIQWKLSECDVKPTQSGPTKFRHYTAKGGKTVKPTTVAAEDKLVQDFSAKAAITKKKTEIKTQVDESEDTELALEDEADALEEGAEAPELDADPEEEESKPEPTKKLKKKITKKPKE